MDAGCTLIAGLCATEQSLGYLLVDTQSQFQVRFDPLCPHWEELNLREEKKKKKSCSVALWTWEAVSQVFQTVLQLSHVTDTCAKCLQTARCCNVSC